MEHTLEGRMFTDIVLDIFKLSGLLVVEGDRLTKELGLTSARWKVLGALSSFDKPMTVAQIAHTMGQSRQGVQRITDSMAKEGIVNYQNNPHHKRAKLIFLTPKGKKIYKMLDQIQVPWANQIAADMSLEHLEKTLYTLRNMIQRFDP